MRVARVILHTETENLPTYIVLHRRLHRRFGSTRNRALRAYTLLKMSYISSKRQSIVLTKMREEGREGG